MHANFAELAKRELEAALSVIPSDSTYKTVLFIELLRVLDYWTVVRFSFPEKYHLAFSDFDLIRWGWNRAVEYLFCAVAAPGAFPMMESTEESRNFAVNLLNQFGRVSLMERTSEMIRFGFMTAESVEEGYRVRQTELSKNQFIDLLEILRLKELESSLDKSLYDFRNGWQVVGPKDYSRVSTEIGSFLGHDSGKPLEESILEDVDELMRPLIHPWDSGHGVMVGYDADPRVDNHFLALALQDVLQWRTEAGIHPEMRFGELSGAELNTIIAFVVALHMKHLRFCLLALEQDFEISFPLSLTIWGPETTLAESIADFSDFDIELVRKGLSTITMRADEASNLHNMTAHFFPLLLSLDNGVLLRPVSSLILNPFLSTVTLQKWRNQSITDQLAKPREQWMRTDLYALFYGTRYMLVDGNINLRVANRTVTDVDAAVIDLVSGELALFQIKWQDYFTNDVRELRSKASNFTKEMDDWAGKVSAWIEEFGTVGLIKTFRLAIPKEVSISSVYLFGISKTYARMQGFGFATSNQNVALATWAQFRRTRYEVGPVESVFGSVFEILRKQMDATAQVHPLPVNLEVFGTSIRFEDLWVSYDDHEKDS